MSPNLRWLPLIVFGITLVEVSLLVRVAHALGFGLLLLLGLALIAGAALFRHVRRRAPRAGFDRGAAVELADRAVLTAAAVLLIIPGVLSDLVAIAMLVPGNRRALARGLAARFGAGFEAANTPFADGARRADAPRSEGSPNARRPAGRPAGGGRVIEGEFIRRDDSRADKT